MPRPVNSDWLEIHVQLLEVLIEAAWVGQLSQDLVLLGVVCILQPSVHVPLRPVVLEGRLVLRSRIHRVVVDDHGAGLLNGLPASRVGLPVVACLGVRPWRRESGFAEQALFLVSVA